jgi:stage V sporulation protein D (sporulation-specific penicillin-binding protein)
MGKAGKTRKSIRRKRYADAMSKSTAVPVLSKQRLGLGFLLIVVLFAVLAFRLAYWQVVRAEDLNERAIVMQKQDIEVEPSRGIIYDKNMKPLAQNVTEYELYGYSQTLYKSLDLSDKERAKRLKELSEIIGVDKKELKKTLEGDENLVKLASGLSQEQVQAAKKKWNDSIVVRTNVTRSYPNGDFAAHVLGSVNSNNAGITGIEAQYNTYLAGTKGRVVRTTDSQGNALSTGGSKYYRAINGYNVVTTLDEVVQHYVEDALDEGMAATGAESITCIVMNPKTGEVLAMAHTPDFDPNTPNKPKDEASQAAFDKLSASEQSEYLSEMWTNPAVSGVYEPGSTFKLVTSSSAIDLGVTNDKSTYYCPGHIDVSGTIINCWGNSAHGTQNITQAVGNSCNPALARVALDMGAEDFYHYIDLYGFMDTTGIDLPGEANSIVKDASTLGPVDLATTGFGHGIAITPIQLMCAINAMGNDGVLMKPRVVDKVIDSSGNVVKEYKSEEVRRVISKETADKMRSIMQYYVEEGGGPQAYIEGYRVGGKTGTAYIAEAGHYSNDTVASFIAMAPMDDPQVSILVMVTKPSKTEFGASNAGPIVHDILEQTLPYLGVERKYSESEQKEGNVEMVTVPDVTDMDSSDAIYAINNAGLGYKVEPEGTGDNFHVVDQYPKAGQKIKKGGTVYLYSE